MPKHACKQHFLVFKKIKFWTLQIPTTLKKCLVPEMGIAFEIGIIFPPEKLLIEIKNHFKTNAFLASLRMLNIYL